MIGLKFFVDNKRQIVEAISEPYSVVGMTPPVFIMIKWLNDNVVSQIDVQKLESIPTNQEYFDWNKS